MRIALVTETFFPAVDATTRTVKALADRLVDSGHQVRLIAPGPGLATYRGCRVVRIRPQERTGRQVRAALDDFAPDLVHATSPGRLGRRALEHAHGTGVATLVVEQSPLLKVAADQWRGSVAERADAMLVTSSWMVERLAGIGVAAHRWRPGVDTAAFTPELRDPRLHASWSRARSRSGHPGTRVVVGYVGSLRNRHDVRRLTELAGLPGIRLVVVGEGPQRDRLRSRLPEARFAGVLSTGDLTVAMASLDLLVHPGEHETCCHALREAAASGVPVVAPRRGGAPEVVRHLETGLLYEPADRRGLSQAVTSLAADRHRGLLGRRARELAGARDWPAAVDELVTDHYQRLVPSPAPIPAVVG